MLWIWNWTSGGYNSCKAVTRDEALRLGNAMGEESNLVVDQATLHEGTYEELALLLTKPRRA